MLQLERKKQNKEQLSLCFKLMCTCGC